MTAKTFLDLVRAYADATLAACDAECSLSTHRLDAARDLGALKANPELATSIAKWAAGEIARCGVCKQTIGSVIYMSSKCPEHAPPNEWDWSEDGCDGDCTHNLGL